MRLQGVISFFKPKKREVENGVGIYTQEGVLRENMRRKTEKARPWKKTADLSFLERVKFGWQAFKNSKKLKHGLITYWDTELNIPEGVRPSEFEEGLNKSCKLSIRSLDHLGKEHVVRIYPFRPY